jgi:hypothetical protein
MSTNRTASSGRNAVTEAADVLDVDANQLRSGKTVIV